MEEENKFNFKWLLLIIGLGLLLYVSFFRKGETIIEDDSFPVDVVKGQEEGSEEVANSTYNKPQYSEQNPRPESVDPFTPDPNFEIMMNSNQNKTDFDFSFENQKEVPTFSLNNGVIDFELLGTLRTATELENKVPLSLEIYTNDQISLTKRKVLYIYDLPFIKETEKKKSSDKILYSFDFKQSMQLESGLYYFLIIPTGRNRILYTGKFNAK
jgi:hypothetical protein